MISTGGGLTVICVLLPGGGFRVVDLLGLQLLSWLFGVFKVLV